MEHTAVFEEQVSLTPRDLRGQITAIDSLLEEKCKTRLEGHCSRHGFVVPDSVKLLSRSMGSVERGRFTGNIIFHVQAEGTVLNPPDGIIVEGTVIRKNKMGLYVNYKDAVRVIIPRDINIGNDEFELVEVGATVSVEIKKSRFQINDEYILSVGLFNGNKGASKQKKVTEESDEEIEDEDEETKEDIEDEETKEESDDEETKEESDGEIEDIPVAAAPVAVPNAPPTRKPFVRSTPASTAAPAASVVPVAAPAPPASAEAPLPTRKPFVRSAAKPPAVAPAVNAEESKE